MADSSEFTFEVEVNAAYGIIVKDANKVSEQLHSQFIVIEKLHLDVILGFDWLKSVKL